MTKAILYATSPHFTADERGVFNVPFAIVNESFRPEIGSTITHNKLCRTMTWTVTEVVYQLDDDSLVSVIVSVTGLKKMGDIN